MFRFVKRVASCQRCSIAKLCLCVCVSLLLSCIKKPSSRRAGIAIVMCSFRDADPLDAGSFFSIRSGKCSDDLVVRSQVLVF